MHKLCDMPEKKMKIYMAAAQVFAKKGFYRATIEEIAQEANIGKSTVYEYVESKEQLFSDVVKQGFNFYMEALEKTIKEADSIDEKIRGFVRMWLYLIKNHYSLYKVILCDYYDPCRCKDTDELFLALGERMDMLLADTVAADFKSDKLRDINISLMSVSLVGMLMGVSSWFERYYMDVLDVEKLGQEISDIFLQGIMVKL